MEKQKHEAIQGMSRLGITLGDAESLWRIALTLTRWHEKECGIEGGCIEYDESGRPGWTNSFFGSWRRIPDKKNGAQRRLNAIMSRYPCLGAYIQTDPRGLPLYLYRVEELEGRDLDSVYSTIGLAIGR